MIKTSPNGRGFLLLFQFLLAVLCVLGGGNAHHGAKDIAEIIGIIEAADHGCIGYTAASGQLVLGQNDA